MVILILYFVIGWLISIMGLCSLSGNCVCVTRTIFNLRISFTMSPLSKRLHMINATLLTQKGGNPLTSRKSLKMILCFQIITLWQLKSHQTRLWRKSIFKINHSGKDNDYVGELCIKSDATCHKCGKMGCVQIYCQYNWNCSNGDSTMKLIRDLP